MSAPSSCFADWAHHDACAHVSAYDKYPRKRLAQCELQRSMGIKYVNETALGWARSGGLSEAISRTLLPLISIATGALNCCGTAS